MSVYFFGTLRVITVTDWIACGAIVTVKVSQTGFMPSYIAIGTTS